MKYLTLLLLLSFNAFADTATFTFVPPDSREDNTPLLPADIGGYNIFLNGVPVNAINPLLPAATGFTLDLPSGAHTVTVTTLDTDTRESSPSTPLAVSVPFSPKPVSGMSVVITITVN